MYLIVLTLLGTGCIAGVLFSLVDSDSVGGESGFEEQEVSEVQSNVVKFVAKFIDKVLLRL